MREAIFFLNLKLSERFKIFKNTAYKCIYFVFNILILQYTTKLVEKIIYSKSFRSKLTERKNCTNFSCGSQHVEDMKRLPITAGV